MSQIIVDRQIVEDSTQLLRLNEDGSFADVPATGPVLVPLKQYLAQKEALRARGDVGVWFAPDDEPEDLGADAQALAVIAVEFPAFTDGRGFSIGRLLRERYGYTGQLRAFGDVFKDTINYLYRCGFNAFAVRADKDIAEAAKGLDDFTEFYQASVQQPVPLFRRRTLA
ncbi:Uncharacterized conserved protein, DUF934 family [Andreprevotia lacus DSM 23236]|jgi:uncharacterized protein (DUF934 family)|uniref:Uncharacterized conserved protein, DUF934 family n=1 Tax=Andreprevotia lacus DSM 23236 TaxID=1121001 RepID=A0A1W1X9A9_9NEIS|nr:DUF934 domain-containing protein [Andreprevotia lacus]SMC20444.1 Uncharacterized conserved protein, DUF934 family [Andreprevotia lacus DSM 23236]